MPGKLSAPVEVFTHSHSVLTEIGELLVHQLDGATRNVVRPEAGLELIPSDGFSIIMGTAVGFPPVSGSPKELVYHEENFLTVIALSNHQLLLDGLELVVSFHGILGL